MKRLIILFLFILPNMQHVRAQTGVISLAVINLGKDSIGNNYTIGKSFLPVCSPDNYACLPPVMITLSNFTGKRINALQPKLNLYAIGKIKEKDLRIYYRYPKKNIHNFIGKFLD